MGAAESSMALPKAEPSLLIRFPNKEDIGEGDLPIFQVQEVERLINADDAIREKKFFLVSITGVYRSGKSFLLNLMQTYLDYYQKSTESVTHGIWIWNRGFLINDIVIVLIDCQGTGDSLMSTPTLDNLILYLGLQLTNVQILNLKSVLQTNDLERIDMCQHFSDLDPENSLFNCSLLYLLRDYNGDKEYGRKDFLFTRIADNAESDVVKNFASGIEKSFQEIATFALPGPGSKVTDGSDGENLKVDSVDPTFLQAAKKLFRYVFVELPAIQRSSLSNGKHTLRQFKTIGKRAMAEENADVIEEMERILKETLDMFQRDKCVSKHADSPHTLEYLELLRDKRNAIEDQRRILEQLVATKKQNEENERELEKMKDGLQDIQQKHAEQQKVLERERKENKLNQQQFKEEIEKLARETEAKVKAEKDQYEARFKQQQEQQASSLEEIEKLKILVQEKEKLATEDRRKGQEITKKYEEQLKSLQDQLNQNKISQQQFEEQNSKLESLKKGEIEAKDEMIAQLRQELKSKTSKELVAISDDDEKQWYTDVAEGLANF
ncbi:ATL1 [Bugula neritina]|uniref:ATL1 n=1 Tax=Bugula neritina TaxID=10212 RepID=A0A7J7JP37_BUGNE|nr:ATL1 [Bugula neritina]